MTTPRVSVLLTTYNGEDYVQDAIDSMLAQTFTDFEILALDDGSSDGTIPILQRAAALDPRIRVLGQPNQGIARTLNRAVVLTRGPYITLQDQDDISFPTRFEQQVRFLDEHPRVAAVGCSSEISDWQGEDEVTIAFPFEHDSIRQSIRTQGQWIVYQAALLRRSALEAVGGYRTEFPICEDLDLFLRLAERFELANLEDVLYRYRRNTGSITYGKSTALSLCGRFARECDRQRQETGRDLIPLRDYLRDARTDMAHGGSPPRSLRTNTTPGIPGWRSKEQAQALMRACASLPDDPVIVELGAFLGASTVLLAGSCRDRGSGTVHAVDTFDGRGDPFSAAEYIRMLATEEMDSPRTQFESNIERAGLQAWVEIHENPAEALAECWTEGIDLLLVDADDSPAGARRIYECWEPFLKPGGVIVLPNTGMREYLPEHDGNHRLVLEAIVPPSFTGIHCIESETYARKCGSSG